MRTPASGSDADRSPPGAASLPRDGCSGLAASCGLRERRQDFATNLSAPLHAEGCGVLDPVHADEVHLGGDARGPGHRKRGAGAGVARVGRRRCDAGAAGDAYHVGYWLGEEHWGKGYASEVMQLILAHLRGQDVLLVARAACSNPASQRVLEKASTFSRSSSEPGRRAERRRASSEVRGKIEKIRLPMLLKRF
mmetsp:Transcript_144508/g.463081  ORF Transcript_144508/g.463081 Transcript_144508/m.463081 type:complete len:194 (+) Transcript_144508:57-638(+)